MNRSSPKSHPKRTFQDNLKQVGNLALGCIVLLSIFALVLSIVAKPINWLQAIIVPWMFEHVPWLWMIAGLSLALLQLIVYLALISLVIVLPTTLLLLSSRRTRKSGLWGLRVYVASAIFGQVWLWSIVAAVNLAGILWMIIGLLFGGIGVVLIAFVAALVRADWITALVILGGSILTLVPCFLGGWIEHKFLQHHHQRIE